MLDNISSQPIYITEVTEETLETAAEIYFKLTNCPTYNVEMKDYYLKLIKDFPLSTIIITLARLTSTQIESKSVKLKSINIASRSISKSEFELKTSSGNPITQILAHVHFPCEIMSVAVVA